MMTFVEVVGDAQSLTRRQRWSHYLTMIFGLIALVIGLNLRDSALYATTLYVNSQAGIRASYPQNWLIDESDRAYVFRVQDTSQRSFPTTIQVSVFPINTGITQERNVLDALSLTRSQTLTSYSIASRRPYVLPDETPATMMAYNFVATNTNPFLEGIPVVIQGIDILIVKRGQAIVISFLSDLQTYDANYAIFQRFLGSLEF